jgi:hypothetical protein
MSPIDEDTFGRRVRQRLNAGAANISADMSGRLMRARQSALANHSAKSGFLTAVGAIALGDSLHRFRLIVAALVLCIGGIGSYYWNLSQEAIAAAEIDSALLADDVPPNAYIDPGFRQWLSRASSESSSQ